MTTRSKRTPKLLSLLLSTCMALSMVPLSALAADGDVAINETNFPDTVFRAYVQKEFDTNNDSVLSEAEIAGAKEIKAYSSKISSLKGVEHFTALETLECGGNKLTELDVSKNTALEKLIAFGNPLTQLDVTKNTALASLDCSHNQLSQLDVTKNTALAILNCSHNQLTQLDVTKNTLLIDLFCPRNQLTSLDLSHNPKLTKFESNLNGITINQKDGFDYTTLPGSFDVSKVSNVVGGKFDTDTHTFSFDPNTTEATYEYDTGSKYEIVTFTLVCEAPEVPDPEPTENPFTDVPTDRYFYEPVLWAAENGITSGVSDTEFGPHDVCTRAQAVTLLWAGEGKPVVESGTSFNDVEQGDYFYNAVQWAVKNNVTAGIGDGLFGPYDNCQRGQIVTFMYKTFA